ncbi:hypothetical protein TTHERM_000672229 (macronuclear) [Tetrahymena thermophila SB210]|uniref:Uncharacterized protein n=1 Tax=Tetrahymena thermophila (strain SB210) TaxID=312017 RepID=W7XIE9_TETTS|nr:hypothetical protein TTHERM_000672229 [Tetrahymena thermophila SB210]EWS74581.1 hypothetical protein TTHERM_000672229 [Tetrahymena thermophila SB210]|eukprot:XP_012652882.1 hypothetical protein TTHERM_000672229 [Tetrahymena thermophila SB210]
MYIQNYYLKQILAKHKWNNFYLHSFQLLIMNSQDYWVQHSRSYIGIKLDRSQHSKHSQDSNKWKCHSGNNYFLNQDNLYYISIFHQLMSILLQCIQFYLHYNNHYCYLHILHEQDIHNDQQPIYILMSHNKQILFYMFYHSKINLYPLLSMRYLYEDLYFMQILKKCKLRYKIHFISHMYQHLENNFIHLYLIKILQLCNKFSRVMENYYQILLVWRKEAFQCNQMAQELQLSYHQQLKDPIPRLNPFNQIINDRTHLKLN